MEYLTPIIDFLRDSWLTYVLAFVGFIVGLAKFLDALKKIHSHWHDFQAKRSGRALSDEKLKSESMKVAKAILNFLSERQRGQAHVDFDNFQQSTNDMIRHTQETQTLYARDYAAKVNNLRDEFLKIQLTNEELEGFYQHPTNDLGLKAVGIGLATLSEKVKTPNK